MDDAGIRRLGGGDRRAGRGRARGRRGRRGGALERIGGPGGAVAAASLGNAALQQQFADAAQEFHVPQGVLMALSYEQSLWDQHEGAPSVTGNYNVMGLTQVTKDDLKTATGNEFDDGIDAEGSGRKHARRATPTLPASTNVDTSSPALHTLDAAAKLIGASPDELKTDTRQSIRGGAALLASYEKQLTGSLPTDPTQWYAAVAEFGHASDKAAAQQFADRVFTNLRKGVSSTTPQGQVVSIKPDPAAVPQAGSGAGTTVPAAAIASVGVATKECPSTLACDTPAPALYKEYDTSGDYGTYALGNRPADGQSIDYIVIHDAEGTKSGTIATFQQGGYASAHYVVGQDGSVTQLVATSNVAWHAANRTFNAHSVGIEHEGYALKTGSWYTPSEYQSSAALVKYLAGRFGIPLDRQHIIGHDEVPGISNSGQAAQHWDPGPYWDWSYYFRLLGHRLSGNDQPVVGGTVTIAPPYSTSYEPTVNGCSTNPCPGHQANFVYLYQGPGTSYGLIKDSVVSSAKGQTGTQSAADWTDKAVYGETFVVAQVSGSWTAIWYGGQKAWFYNPGGAYAYANSLTQPVIVTPTGSTAQIWGRPYPEASVYSGAYASDAPTIAPLSYLMHSGESYVANAVMTADDYFSDYPSCTANNACTHLKGTTQYYPISFNHRLAFVKASDVTVVPAAFPATSTFTPVTPTRLLDTRAGIGAAKARVGADASIALQITGKAGVPTSGVSAVVLNVTAVNPSASGYVTVYPDGTTRSSASNLNFVAGDVIPNLVTVPVGSDGKVRLYNHAGTVDLVADITGYYVRSGSGSKLTGVGPTRLLDTRYGIGAARARVGAGASIALQITGNAGVPASGVTAVVLNVTAVNPSGSSYVTVYPDGTTRTSASNLNFTAKQVISNLVIVPVGADGKVRLYNHYGTVDLVADINGYYSGSGAVFHTVSPVRVMDTRSGTGVRTGVLGTGGTVKLTVGAANGVPLNAKAVVLNVTAVGPTAAGYLTVYPDGKALPSVSNVNFRAGQTIPNLVVVPVVNGTVDFYNHAGNVNVVADLTGYFTG
ncbi:N-acetylmuramoyl-L-alanine amidase [Streptacidiphilus monticola]